MAAPLHPPLLPNSIKELSDGGGLSSIPSLYASQSSKASDAVEHEVPIIDFLLLKNGTADQHSQTVRDLGKACKEWGFFMVVNHGVPERLRDEMVDALGGFFDLTWEEKGEYTGKHVMDPIRRGTSFNLNVDRFRFWRDYLKVFVHPVFHSPAKPHGFREISQEYTTCIRVLAMDLLAGIWESLGLEEGNMTTALDLHSCFQIFIGNYYPPCPQPELAMGLPPHSDHGLLTILLQNGVDGLQLQHKGNWVNVKPHPNSPFLLPNLHW
ncbi:protein DMR6-LIKE OXYGENASE 2 [Cocos nucifera]|uniref:Protein DMR6-LIKE OXYGENASE 2 n=1 Tax=Cocos nucifera TaxID=13894 RepID=A0A8K0NBB0_COCNU|nr:protein DMR6-LIKE OXYGENASE 2 [Cocos nucifera]